MAVAAAAVDGFQRTVSPSFVSRTSRCCSNLNVVSVRVPLRRGMSDDEVESQTRIQFKYGCLHDVFGTPQVFIGGVLADNLDGGATFQDWQDLLDPLVGGVAARANLNGRAAMNVV